MMCKHLRLLASAVLPAAALLFSVASAQAQVKSPTLDAVKKRGELLCGVDTGIPGGEGLRVDIDQGGLQGAVIFVTFPVGSDVYGIQAVATSPGNLDQDEILGAARDLANKAANR